MKRITQFGIRILTTILFLCGIVYSAQAQDVTVKPSTGNMIASTPTDVGSTEDYDTFFKLGGFATWRHNQLNITMTTSDETKKTANGQLSNPANNLYAETDIDAIQIGKGATFDTYIAICLPKGFRFTGYAIQFSWNKKNFGTETDVSKAGKTKEGTYIHSSIEGAVTFGETDADFKNYTTSADVTYNETVSDDTKKTISREDATGMSNILYFKLSKSVNGRAAITMHSIKLYFTAEGDYTPVIPSLDITTPVSATDIPFETSKVDYGTIENRTYDGETRVSYSSANVTDLTGYLTLFEAESVESGSAFDGTSGNIVKYNTGSDCTITTAGDYFKLGKADKEQIYYVETPVYVELTDEAKTKNPVGYRIVGGSLSYTNKSSETNNYIGYRNSEWDDDAYTYVTTTYYLVCSSTGSLSHSTSEKTEWFEDENGYVYCVVDGTTYYLSCNSSGQGKKKTYSLSTSTTVPTNPFVVSYSYVRTNSYFGNNYLYVDLSSSTIGVSTNYNNYWASESSDVTVEDYTIKVYSNDGATVLKTIDVNDNNASGTYTLPENYLNNDAIKFGVEGIGLVNASVTIQALDPYIDRMTVVCKDNTEGYEDLNISQSFTASDFAVNGGEFYFYLPDDCKNHNVAFSFEDLYSKYGDETYDEGSNEHTSRYSFVKSLHFNKYGDTNNNVYNDVKEAASSELESKRTDNVRTKVSVVGTKAFTFNNAADFDGSSTTASGNLIEYPFTLEKYEGEFKPITFTVSETDQSADAYVFTTDETRYNIAPTTATQHRTYAFYDMKVHVLCETYTPTVEIKKIYNNSFNEGGKTEFYGAKVNAKSADDAAGYASSETIINAIQAVIDNKKDDNENTDVPTSVDQLLYLDMSDMAGVFNYKTTFAQYKETMSKNALIFLPKGASMNADNFAYKTEIGMRAANNIVLTDKYPFYSPYDIQVPGENYACYTRLQSAAKYGQVQWATLILPFALKLDNGVYTDENGGSTLEIYQMNKDNALSDKGDYKTDPAIFFSQVSDSETKANTGYVVHVKDGTQPEEETQTFIIKQAGAKFDNCKLSATPEEIIPDGYISTGTIDGENLTFTQVGTFSGTKINKNKTNAYYIANNVLNATYNYKYNEVKMYPFRSYYIYEGKSNAAKLNIVIGENDWDETTGISNVNAKYAGVQTGEGTITITAENAGTYRIFTVAGQNKAMLNMQAGETRTVNVPAGIYLVNGVKVLVK